MPWEYPFVEPLRPSTLPLDHESAADTEKRLDGSSRGGLVCVRQLEQNFTMDQIIGVGHVGHVAHT